MNTVSIGLKKSPAIGMGTWHMGEQLPKHKEEVKALQTGIELGLTLIDTAEMYGEGLAETLVGEAIKPYKREDLTLVTKVYPWNASRKKMRKSLENSLKLMQTDYADMYLLHWRGDVPLEETVEAFEKLKAEGKIRAWGVSNFDTEDMIELETITSNCAVNQVLYNMGSRGTEFDLQPWMGERHMPMMAYTPLGQGDTLHAGFRKNSVLQNIAAQHECTIFQLLLSWCIRSGSVIAIPQSGDAEHVKANRAALDIQLTDEELHRIDSVYPKPASKMPLDML